MKAARRFLEWILIASIGGGNRVKILIKIFEKPYNANELSKTLNLDYKTTRYHLRFLQKNNLIISSRNDYGRVYYPSDYLERNKDVFDEICNKIGKKDK